MKRLLFLTLFLSSISVFAQTDEETSISADRPGMATGTDIVSCMKVQWETGFESTYDGSTGFLLPSTMLRMGVTPFAELRVEYDGNLNMSDKQRWSYEVEPLVVGTKVKVFDGYGWVPKTSLMANLSIPLRRNFDETGNMQHVAPSLYLLFQNGVTEWFDIGYNVGIEWSGYSHIPSTFLALCLAFSVSDHFGAFFESYNYFTHLDPNNTEAEFGIDLGLTYSVHPRVQLDVYGMFNCPEPRMFNGLGLGVAWLVN